MNTYNGNQLEVAARTPYFLSVSSAASVTSLSHSQLFQIKKVDQYRRKTEVVSFLYQCCISFLFDQTSAFVFSINKDIQRWKYSFFIQKWKGPWTSAEFLERICLPYECPFKRTPSRKTVSAPCPCSSTVAWHLEFSLKLGKILSKTHCIQCDEQMASLVFLM